MAKVDLSIEFCGMKLRNPLIVTVGPLTRDGAAIKKAAENGAGAVMTRFVYTRGGKDPKLALIPLGGGILNATTYSDLGIDEWMKEYAKAKKAGIPIIGSIYVPGAKPSASEYVELAKKLTEAGLDMLHVVVNLLVLDYDETRAILKAVKRASDLPICVNLDYTADIGLMGRKMKEAGADAALAVDGPWAMKIDVMTGRPVLGNLDGSAHLCGKPMHPLAVYSIYKLAKAVDLPLIGSCGVSSGEDALEFMLAGATAVGIQSAAIIEGYEKIQKVINEMHDILEAQKVRSAKEIIGKTVKLMKGRTEKDMEYYEQGNLSLTELRKILLNP